MVLTGTGQPYEACKRCKWILAFRPGAKSELKRKAAVDFYTGQSQRDFCTNETWGHGEGQLQNCIREWNLTTVWYATELWTIE